MTSAVKSHGAGAVCALFFCLILQSCGDTPEQALVISGSTMGTYYRVSVSTLPAELTEEDLKSIIETRLGEINSRMSTYLENSEVSHFNQSTDTGWFPVSADTAKVVIEALRVFQQSEGAFDITVGPLVNLWGFGPAEKKRQIPDQSSIKEALQKIGSKHLQARLSPPALKKEISDLQIDLSAIAKGFAVDAVAESLKAEGLISFLVDIGGEMLASGKKTDDVPWRIAIESPNAKKHGIQSILPLTNQAIATSGDYRNYFESKGQRFSHEIDPRTGQSINHSLVSVSVLDKSCMRADAWATALIVLGPKRGKDLAAKAKLPFFFILSEKGGFNELKSAGFDQQTSLP